MNVTTIRILAVLVLAGALSQTASAQSSSLFGDPCQRQPLSLSSYSWMYQPPEELRQLRLNDLVMVIVDEKQQVQSDGQVDRRRKTDGSWKLKDWIVFIPGSFGIMPDPQSKGDQTIAHQADGKYRAEATLETLETMRFRLMCRVVDVRPNGNLVIEGRRVVQNNDESWEVAITGEIRPEDILPNNTVLSESILYPRISKRETGIIRDGYRRGWFLEWRDRYKAL